jgi:hypothetical protein
LVQRGNLWEGHQKVVEVLISPLSIAPKLRQSLFEKLQTVVCTSATLDLNDDFQYWSSRVGLPLQSDRSYLKATSSRRSTTSIGFCCSRRKTPPYSLRRKAMRSYRMQAMSLADPFSPQGAVRSCCSRRIK